MIDIQNSAIAKKVRKAVIPVAGLGTRFLPATKAIPKEMLPVVDKPAIQYVVEEAVAAGLEDIMMITGRNKRNIEDHFDRASELEMSLEKKGDTDKLVKVQKSTGLADIHYIRQGDPKGLGHAILMAKQHVGNEPFAVLLGDDLIDERDPLLKEMIKVQQATGGSVIALMKVDSENISAYGCADVEESSQDFMKVNALVEKPKVEEAPSNFAIIGRYILSPDIFPVLENTAPGRGNEIQLTDALNTLAAQGTVYSVVFQGRRYDTGDRLDYLKAVVRLGSEHEDLGPDLKKWLKEFAPTLDEK